MSQLTYAEQAAAFAGMLADSSILKHADSMLQGEVSAEIPFGVAVMLFAAPTANGTPALARRPSASTDKVWGFVLHSHDYDVRRELGTTGLKPKTTLSVLRRGRIWVISETAAAAGDRVFVRYAAGAGGTQLGAIRNATVASEMIDAQKQAVYITSCSAGGLAIIECDFTTAP